MVDRDYDRDRQRNWDREERWREPGRGNRREEWMNQGSEWGREGRYENQPWRERAGGREHSTWTRGDEPEHWNREREERWREPEWSNREEERWRDRSSPYSQRYENYQRGASGSEGGYGTEQSYGSTRDFSNRGGGTGQRESERWRSRDRDTRDDYGSSGFAGTGMGSGWAGGMGTYTGRGMQTGERGRFAGRGPKGWRRSDERIREDINERLTAHPDIDATEIDVQVRECEVTLLGTVEDRSSKRMAEELAENVAGVKEVHNNIRIQRSEDRYREGSGQRTSQPAGSQQQYAGQQPGQQLSQQTGSPQYQGAGSRNR
jgi:osmotically-inducible protein OsmY